MFLFYIICLRSGLSNYTAENGIKLQNKYELCILLSIKNGTDFKIGLFGKRKKLSFGCMYFRAPRAALKQKKCAQRCIYANNYELVSRSIELHQKSHLFKTIEPVLSLLYTLFRFFFIFQKITGTYACHLCVEYVKWK